MSTLALPERVADRIIVDPDTGCWLYQGRIHASGYGMIDLPRTETAGKTRSVYTHRVMYETVHGPIPDGLEVDHLCRVRVCVNPEHLEAVTHRENDLRGMAPSAIAWRTDTCGRGHSLADAYVTKKGRKCRPCAHAYNAAWKRRRNAARKAS